MKSSTCYAKFYAWKKCQKCQKMSRMTVLNLAQKIASKKGGNDKNHCDNHHRKNQKPQQNSEMVSLLTCTPTIASVKWSAWEVSLFAVTASVGDKKPILSGQEMPNLAVGLQAKENGKNGVSPACQQWLCQQKEQGFHAWFLVRLCFFCVERPVVSNNQPVDVDRSFHAFK